MEVNLNDLAVESKGKRRKSKLVRMGAVDFIGELPDGQILMIEFRRPGHNKTRQIAKHTRGVHEVLRLHNGEETMGRISQFVATYEDTEEHSLVKILPRHEQFLPFTGDQRETTIYQSSAA